MASAAKLRRNARNELARRARANRLQPPAVKVEKVCHPKQASLVQSLVFGKRRNLSVLCGRQSGKSHGGALAALLTAAHTPGVNVLYVTSTHATCEKMAFLPAVSMNREYGLGGDPLYGQKMQIRLPNGSVVYFLGADSEKTIERLRGTPNLVLCIIDEAGIYDPEKLRKMIRAVRPGLRPRGGKLCVMGTPSQTGKQGTFWEITENQEYEQHRFGYRDNDRVPEFERVEDLIDEDLRAEFPGLTPEAARLTAWYLREYEAQFVVDLAELVYKLAEFNLVDSIPDDLDAHQSAGDLGVSANDSLLSIGWKRDGGDGSVYVTDAEEESGQDTIAYAEMVRSHYKKRRPFDIAIDPGGLGQKTIMTVQKLFPGIPVSEAIKGPMGLQVKPVNTLLQSGRLKIKRGSKLALAMARHTWVDGKVGGDIDEHGQHSDLTPPLRYACIKAIALLPEILPEPTAEELARRRYLEGVRRAERNRLAQQPDRGFDQQEFSGGDLFDDMP